MAIGDAAAAAGMTLVDGATTQANTIDTELNRTRDYIVTHGKPGTGGVTTAMLADKSVTSAKLADDSVDASKIKAGAVGADELAPDSVDSTKIKANSVGASDLAPGAVGGRELNDNVQLHNVAAKYDVRIAFSDNLEAPRLTLTNHLYIPNATVVSSSYVAAYINGDGRLGKSPSSRRYKRAIRNAPADLFAGILRLRPRLFKWRKEIDPSNHDEVGLIAEEVAELAPWLVVTDEDGRPEAVRYELLGLALLPIVQDLARRVAALEAADG